MRLYKNILLIWKFLLKINWYILKIVFDLTIYTPYLYQGQSNYLNNKYMNVLMVFGCENLNIIYIFYSSRKIRVCFQQVPEV